MPATCPAAHTSAVRQLPSTRLAPNMASAIRAGQAVANVWVTNAEATREPAAWVISSLRQAGHPATEVQLSGLAAIDARDPQLMMAAFVVPGRCSLIGGRGMFGSLGGGVLHDPALRILLLLPASHQYSDLRGSLAVIDPARPTVALDRDGSADVIVEYARTSDPAHVAAVRAAVERSRLAIEIARLGVGLNRQLAEVERSRARIASAADDERRRIQRDLHDGAQQRLVTIGISLRAAEARIRAEGLTAEADRLDTAVADLAATIAELRNLTQKLPPAQLDTGIGAAFRELAGRAPLPITIDVAAERLDRHIEATAYFVGCEGLTNVIKHARASAATLSAVRRNGSLIVTVADDGVGGAAARPGSGLAGLADRVQAVGGQLVVRSDATGTLLTAELPCG